MTTFAADASTLILLAKAELLIPVGEDFSFLIPIAVRDECLATKTWDGLMISAAIEAKRIEVDSKASPDVVKSLSRDFGLHQGEAEAVELAIRTKKPLAVDDYAAIKACRILRIEFATAVHFLIAMRMSGRLDHGTAEAKLEKLSRFGRYSSRILQDALGRISGGE